MALTFAVVALLSAVGYIILSEPATLPAPDLELTEWQARVAHASRALAADRERAASATVLPGGEAVRHAFVRFNHVEIRSAGDLSPAVEAAHTALHEALRVYVKAHGHDAAYALGLIFQDHFLAALDALLRAAQTAGENPIIFPQRHPLEDVTTAFRTWCGGFLAHAVRAGLIQEDGSILAGAEHIPSLFFMARWRQWLRPFTEKDTPDVDAVELGALLAWKVEASGNLRLTRRLELLDELAAIDPSYPAGYVRGVLQAREAHWSEAAESWRRWLTAHPDDERATQNLRFAESVLR